MTYVQNNILVAFWTAIGSIMGIVLIAYGIYFGRQTRYTSKRTDSEPLRIDSPTRWNTTRVMPHSLQSPSVPAPARVGGEGRYSVERRRQINSSFDGEAATNVQECPKRVLDEASSDGHVYTGGTRFRMCRLNKRPDDGCVVDENHRYHRVRPRSFL